MQRQNKIIKTVSTVIIEKSIQESKSVHPVYLAHKIEKASGSLNRKNKKWIYKANKIQASTRNKMKTDFLDQLPLVNPLLANEEIQKRWEETFGNKKCEATFFEKLETDFQFSNLVDVIITEYICFMSNTPYKARIVMDDKNEKLMGKLAVFIKGIKTFDELTNLAEINAEIYNYDIDLGYAFDKVEYQKLITKMKELKTSALTKMYNAITNGPNKQQRLSSFAQACVLIQRLNINDMTLRNIGIDEIGNIVLFDSDQALWALQNQESKTDVVDLISQLDYSRIHQQPYRFEVLANYTKDSQHCHDTFKNFLGDDYIVFEDRVYRCLLKEIICPDDFIMALVNAHTIGGKTDDMKRICDFLLLSKQKLKSELLRESDFVSYLQKNGDQDIKEILAEFKQAQDSNRHYFEQNPKLKVSLLTQVETEYSKIMKAVAKEFKQQEKFIPIFFSEVKNSELEFENRKNLHVRIVNLHKQDGQVDKVTCIVQ